MASDAFTLESWDVSKVERWLRENGFEMYINLFCKTHKIDGLCLLNLTENELKEPPMEIKILGDVKRLWLAILQLRKSSGCYRKTLNYSRTSTPDDLKATATDYSDGRLYTDNSDSDIDPPEIFVKLSSLGDKGRTLLAVVYCFLVLIITSLTMTVVHDRVPDMNRYPPLPDIFLDNMPLIPWAFYICELSASIMGFILVGVLITHKHRLILIRRICAIVGTVFLLRCVTMFVTSLSVPGVHLECSGKVLPFIKMILFFLLPIWHNTCRFLKHIFIKNLCFSSCAWLAYLFFTSNSTIYVNHCKMCIHRSTCQYVRGRRSVICPLIHFQRLPKQELV